MWVKEMLLLLRMRLEMLNSQENSELRFPQQLGVCPPMHYNRGPGAIITGHWAAPATVQQSVRAEKTELDHRQQRDTPGMSEPGMQESGAS